MKRVNSTTEKGGDSGKGGRLLILPLTFLRCGFEGSDVSASDWEFRFPGVFHRPHDNYTYDTKSVLKILMLLRRIHFIATQSYLLSVLPS